MRFLISAGNYKTTLDLELNVAKSENVGQNIDKINFLILF